MSLDSSLARHAQNTEPELLYYSITWADELDFTRVNLSYLALLAPRRLDLSHGKAREVIPLK